MDFEFDPGKWQQNLEKHGIDFTDLEPVFRDKNAFTQESDRETSDGAMEKRWITTGMDAVGRLVTVAWTRRGSRIRLISARHARKSEKEDYEQA